MIAFLEIPFYALNEAIGLAEFKAADIGGSMLIHTFGAYFGLGVSLAGFRTPSKANTREPTSDRVSNLVAAVGTVFLWMFWPSFNGALGAGSQQHRVILNTVFALCACGVTSMMFARIVKGQFDIEIFLNSTLAGGVAIGTTADIISEPWAALTIGGVAGILSAAGYCYVTPFLERKIGLYDTCGVHNLHGMPGVLAGIAGAI